MRLKRELATQKREKTGNYAKAKTEVFEAVEAEAFAVKRDQDGVNFFGKFT